MVNSTSRVLILASAAIVGLSICAHAETQWKPVPGILQTRWTKEVKPNNVLPDYPRPQMVRKAWSNLNGLWDVAFTARDAAQPASFDQKIMVPFPVESALSGIAKRIEAKDRIWYKRSFDIPAGWKGQNVLLHFGAVDWESTVYVNGKEIGTHKGGYDPFTYDITSAIKPGGPQEIVVSVWDPTTDGNQPVGKQSLSPGGCFYTPCSGIWQTVWLEAVPSTYISSFKITPDMDKSCLNVTISSNSGSDAAVTAVALDKGRKITEVSGKPGQVLTLPIKDAKLWSPSSPYLYDLKLTMKSGKAVDEVSSYFAMRKIEIGKDEKGITRPLLNGKFVFQLGPLDQGYWPDGNYTAPTDAAILFDLNTLKASGFNMIRKHIKVEPARWYYWCDKLGFVVWQDMPSLPLHEVTAEGKANYEAELSRIIDALYNTPSIIMWVPFNEAWGQFDTARIVEKIRQQDPTRLINNASGWIDNGVGDVSDWHRYPGPSSPKPEENRAAVLGEFGGLGMISKGHLWFKDGWGYDLLPNTSELTVRYEQLFKDMQPMIDKPGLSAAVYTQVSDIEGEINGFMTYDREIIKINPAAAANAAKYLFPPSKVGDEDKFVGSTSIQLTARPEAKIYYTLDGSNPTKSSQLYAAPIKIDKDTQIKAIAVMPDGSVSRAISYDMKSVKPLKAVASEKARPGLELSYCEDNIPSTPDFDKLKLTQAYIAKKFDLSFAKRGDGFALKYGGYINVPTTGVYTFYCLADDSATLTIDGVKVIDDPTGHGAKERNGCIALEAGAHKIALLYAQSSGGKALKVSWAGPGIEKQEIPADVFSYTQTLDIQCLPPVPGNYSLMFSEKTSAVLACEYAKAKIRYTTDGSEPTESSTLYSGPIDLSASTSIKARAFMDGLRPSDVMTYDYIKTSPAKAVSVPDAKPGLGVEYYEVSTDVFPDYDKLTPAKTFVVDTIGLPPTPKSDGYALKYEGFIKVPKTGAYAFYVHADDQARVIVAGKTVVDRVHFSDPVKKGEAVLEEGLQPITILLTQGSGDAFLKMQIEGPGLSKGDIAPSMLFHAE